MSNTKNAQKDQFASKLGFILAAAGSAVGLGNLWRFPYLAAQYGGGFFLIVYILLAITFGFALMVTEISIGRKTGKSVIGAYKSMNSKFGFLGVIAAIVPFIITPYYCVIGGWVIKYFTTFVTGGGSNIAKDSTSFFTGFVGGIQDPTICFVIFVALTSIAVLLGVQKGIEKLSKVLMPALLVIIVGIAIYVLTQPGAMDGLKYYLLPNFDDFSVGMLVKTIVAATGQLFYSMSLAMGIMVTYGSYMRKEDNIEKSVRQIEIFDTAVALLAGLIIVPAVFVFSGGDKSALNSGPSLMFITLPNVFNSMALGDIIGSVFFILVILAALTSSISLLETVASIIAEKFNLKRIPSTLISIFIILALGMVSVLGYNLLATPTANMINSIDSVLHINANFGLETPLDLFDFISNNILMPIVAFITCILVGWVVKTKYIEDEILVSQESFKASGLYRVMIKVVCPIFMIAILVTPFIVKL